MHALISSLRLGRTLVKYIYFGYAPFIAPEFAKITLVVNDVFLTKILLIIKNFYIVVKKSIFANSLKL